MFGVALGEGRHSAAKMRTTTSIRNVRKKKDEEQRAKRLLYCGVTPNLLIDSKNHLGATVEMNIAPLGTDYGCIGRS
jgi:hypothetical protein